MFLLSNTPCCLNKKSQRSKTVWKVIDNWNTLWKLSLDFFYQKQQHKRCQLIVQKCNICCNQWKKILHQYNLSFSTWLGCYVVSTESNVTRVKKVQKVLLVFTKHYLATKPFGSQSHEHFYFYLILYSYCSDDD